MLEILDANDAALVPSLYMLLHIRRILRDEIAVGALKSWRLAAFVSQMRHQAALRAIHARAIRAGKSIRSPRIVVLIFRRSGGRLKT